MVERLTRDNWTDKSADFIISDIVEYDMKRAGLSIIKEEKLLSQSEIDRLEKLDKEKCNKTIGLMERTNKELKERKKESFRKYRMMFAEANELTDDDILSVKKDAIFIKKFCYNTTFGNYIEFAEKNVYEAFLLLDKLEIYWNSSGVDIKGINDDLLKLHKDYIVDTIWKFIGYLTRYDYDGARRYIVKMMDDYKKRLLPVGFYREFNQFSKYICYLNETDSEPSSLANVGDSMKPNMIIGYNYLNVFVPLLKLVVD